MLDVELNVEIEDSDSQLNAAYIIPTFDALVGRPRKPQTAAPCLSAAARRVFSVSYDHYRQKA